MIARLAALFCLAAAPLAAQDLPDLQGREVVVATENAYPPLQFVDPASGTPVGWEYDALAEIAARLNMTVVYETIAWDAMIPAVSEGQMDMGMTGITIREDRAEMVDFSAPYMRSEMVMLVRGDEARFDDAASFAADPDLLMGAQPGTTPFYVGVYEVLDGDETNPRIALFDTFGVIDTLVKGEPGNNPMTLVYKVFVDGFRGNDLGGSSAQSVILMVLVLALTVFQFRMVERRIHYT